MLGLDRDISDFSKKLHKGPKSANIIILLADDGPKDQI